MKTSHIMLALICAGSSLTACAHATASGRPRLASLAPDSVRIIPGNVTEVELRGSAFDESAESANVVTVGPLVFRAVPATSGGTKLRVVVPATVPSTGEAPPSLLASGRYDVFVSTKFGTSDTLSLFIRMFGGAP